ncbi:DUF2630 family protein [Actinopolymorpha alba]|uniref:DUF2630 family protein n=1 Tax=Actinopolymorpha alba TaxID=533267 RepID=UPI00036A1435|nr:DUF2630 family protein [Actinopolymorpha alba]
MDDQEILNHVRALVDYEHALRQKVQTGDLSAEEEGERLRELETTLDQCWDLLRQRRALREAAANPDVAKVRPAEEVEGYQQ